MFNQKGEGMEKTIEELENARGMLFVKIAEIERRIEEKKKEKESVSKMSKEEYEKQLKIEIKKMCYFYSSTDD